MNGILKELVGLNGISVDVCASEICCLCDKLSGILGAGCKIWTCHGGCPGPSLASSGGKEVERSRRGL
ncbi:hypothetical protein HPB50_010338 [Hyalomma asiaticum]|uniref:Uncharacterized protein n=1 Tax=Hyalomma asiaticum TaxID=266040 RepID=A0ACB7T212_HYAAI|nr:hypothetical protein HPB50_010338 [Hyalomma asiaticum]